MGFTVSPGPDKLLACPQHPQSPTGPFSKSDATVDQSEALMSTLSDVQALYGSVQDTWAKSQAHGAVSPLPLNYRLRQGRMKFLTRRSLRLRLIGYPVSAFPRIQTPNEADTYVFSVLATADKPSCYSIVGIQKGQVHPCCLHQMISYRSRTN